MREFVIEEHLRLEVEKRGGLCEKFLTGRRGAPDRIITWPVGMIHFIETKAPGKSAKPHQVRDHKERRRRGVHVFVLNTIAKVDDYIAGCDHLLL